MQAAGARSKWGIAEAMGAFPLPHWEAAETALRAVANAIILYSPSAPVMCHYGGVSKQYLCHANWPVISVPGQNAKY
jgi:hypothetical protein